MIPLADILFGDKKFGNTLNLNRTPNNTVAQSERKERIDIRNNMTDKKDRWIQNVPVKKNIESLSKSLEIKKSINITSNKHNHSDISRNIKEIKSIHNKYKPKEDILYDKLKNFDSLDDVLNEVQKNKEFGNLFKNTSGHKDSSAKIDEKPLKLQGLYKPTTSDEAKVLKKIDELNKIKEIQEIGLLGKKHKNNSGISSGKNAKFITDDDIWCSKCKGWHDKDLHKKFSKQITTIPNAINLTNNNHKNDHRSYHDNHGINKNISSSKPIENLLKSNSFQSKDIPKIPKLLNNNKNSITTKTSHPNEILNKIKHEIKLSNHDNRALPFRNIEFKNKFQTNTNFQVGKNAVVSSNKEIKNKEKIEKLKNFINNSNNNNNKSNQPRESNSHVPKIHHKPMHKPESLTTNTPLGQTRKVLPQKSNYNYSPSNPISQQDFLFSRNDFEDDADDFIDDQEEEHPEEYRKYLDRINNKLRRGGVSYYNYGQDYPDSDDVVEAKFEDIEEEEKYTEMIGQKEDEEEEMRELLESERKRQRKLNKY
jgi:hypothetical protein